LKGLCSVGSSFPLKRIMAVEEQDGPTPVTTHLACGIGQALHHAYQGDLGVLLQLAENLLRVSWIH
jgi:hypothetical protein